MELIKKIKSAEKEAQELIEQARAGAVKDAEEGRLHRVKAMSEAELERKKGISGAVESARAEGLAEVKELKKQAEKDRGALRSEAAGKVDKAAKKVMDYLKG
jgi:V/A-type H+-transporting ATPase subunit G/H